MRKICLVLFFSVLFSACAQTPSESPAREPKQSVNTSRSQKKQYNFHVDASCQVLGFNIMVNGAELLVVDGGAGYVSKIDINDWMVSGNNKLDITIFWPDSVLYSSDISSASFKLFSNDKLLKEFKWPMASPQDKLNSYPYTFTETFKADGFPKVLLERAERIISSAGALPRGDQDEIAAIVKQLRTAFTEKDIDTIDELFAVKYADLAAARFTVPLTIKTEAEKQYRELMNKTDYAVFFNGRNIFLSAADDRAVRLGQGRIGFPQPALVITWKEGKNTARWEMDLYFSKIDGRWVIIR